MKKPLLLIEVSADGLTAALIPSGRSTAELCVCSGDSGHLAMQLKDFIGRFVKARPVVIGLVPRQSVSAAAVSLPTRDPDEARSIALIQFARVTPHDREDLVVDVDLIAPESGSGGRFSCVMATRTALKPLSDVLAGAGLRPQQVAVNISGKDGLDAAPSDPSCLPWDEAQWIAFAQAFDRGDVVFDLRGDKERCEQRQRLVRRKLASLAAVFCAACALSLAAEGLCVWKKVRQIDRLERELAKISPAAKALNARRERTAAFRAALERRISFSAVAAAVAEAIPGDVHLNELAIGQNRAIRFKGTAPGIDQVNAFRNALSGKDLCAPVKLEALDKRPSEAGEEATFVFSCRKEGG